MYSSPGEGGKGGGSDGGGGEEEEEEEEEEGGGRRKGRRGGGGGDEEEEEGMRRKEEGRRSKGEGGGREEEGMGRKGEEGGEEEGMRKKGEGGREEEELYQSFVLTCELDVAKDLALGKGPLLCLLKSKPILILKHCGQTGRCTETDRTFTRLNAGLPHIPIPMLALVLFSNSSLHLAKSRRLKV